MTGQCSRCGNDPGFDWAICPSCGLRAGQPADAPPAGGDRWDPTIVEGTVAAPRERARFGGGGDFYQPVNGPAARGGGLQFRPGEEADRTVMDRGFDRASTSGAMDDRTIIDRGGTRGDDETGDSTVIIRGGRKGIAGPLIYMVQRNGIRAGRVHLLSEETSIGRGVDQDIVLSDETVSKHHAKVRLEDGKYMFWDLASANHSYMVSADGSRTRILEPRELHDGDKVFLGEAQLTYLEVDRGFAE